MLKTFRPMLRDREVTKTYPAYRVWLRAGKDNVLLCRGDLLKISCGTAPNISKLDSGERSDEEWELFKKRWEVGDP